MLTVKNNIGLSGEINVEDESKTLVGHRKRIFWQTSINDLRVCINAILLKAY